MIRVNGCWVFSIQIMIWILDTGICFIWEYGDIYRWFSSRSRVYSSQIDKSKVTMAVWSWRYKVFHNIQIIANRQSGTYKIEGLVLIMCRLTLLFECQNIHLHVSKTTKKHLNSGPLGVQYSDSHNYFHSDQGHSGSSCLNRGSQNQ